MVYKVTLGILIFVSTVFASINKDEIKSFEANFIQKVTNESSKTVVYEGEVYIKDNGNILWKYKTPVLKNVYVLGDLVIVDEPELEQAIYSKLEKSIDILKLLKDATKEKENLYKSKLYDVDYLITIKDDKISSITYKDQLANSVSIDFSNIKQNIQIDQHLFEFLPPKDYDIIEK